MDSHGPEGVESEVGEWRVVRLASLSQNKKDNHTRFAGLVAE